MADDYRMLVGGEWVPSESGATFDATSPSTGAVIGTVPEGTREDVRRAIAAAARDEVEELAAYFEMAAADAVRLEGAIPPSVDAGKRRAPSLGTELFFEPTVIDGVANDMAIAREETIGPVVPITAIRSEDEAVALVDRSEYGLLSAIFTRDLGRGLRFAERVRTGWVNVNEGTNYWESHLPFGGRAGSRS